MAITYPLTPPAAFRTARAIWTPKTAVAMNQGAFTGQQQVLAHRGSFWELELDVPMAKRASADDIEGFLLSLNGPEGTFWYGDKTRTTSRGTAAGTKTVGAGAAASSTTLPVAGGTGSFAVGDWVQVSNQLFRVIKVTSTTSIDVFPKLRTAYASGTSLVYASPKGLFRLKGPAPMSVPVGGNYGPWGVSCVEVVT
jgi:hypothetical protein